MTVQPWDHDELTEERLARLTARVDAGLVPTPSAPAPGLRTVRFSLVVLVLALLASTWILARDTDGADRGPAAASAPSAADLAERASQHAEPAIGDGYAYLHVAEQGVEEARWREQRWLAADGTGQVVHLPLTASGEAGSPATRATAVGELTMGGLTPAQVIALRGTPEQVFAQVQADIGPGGRPESYVTGVVELLAWPGVPGATRAALFQVLGDLGFRGQPTADPGLATLVGPGPNPDDVTTVTVDLATTQATRYATRTGRQTDDLDRVVTFLDAYRTDTHA